MIKVIVESGSALSELRVNEKSVLSQAPPYQKCRGVDDSLRSQAPWYQKYQGVDMRDCGVRLRQRVDMSNCGVYGQTGKGLSALLCTANQESNQIKIHVNKNINVIKFF